MIRGMRHAWDKKKERYELAITLLVPGACSISSRVLHRRLFLSFRRVTCSMRMRTCRCVARQKSSNSFPFIPTVFILRSAESALIERGRKSPKQESPDDFPFRRKRKTKQKRSSRKIYRRSIQCKIPKFWTFSVPSSRISTFLSARFEVKRRRRKKRREEARKRNTRC